MKPGNPLFAPDPTPLSPHRSAKLRERQAAERQFPALDSYRVRGLGAELVKLADRLFDLANRRDRRGLDGSDYAGHWAKLRAELLDLAHVWGSEEWPEEDTPDPSGAPSRGCESEQPTGRYPGKKES